MFRLSFLAVFVLFCGIATLAQTPPPPVVMRLDRIDSITDALAKDHYFYLKEEGFRIKLPGNFTDYVASKPALDKGEAKEGQVVFKEPEATVVIMFGEMDESFAILTHENKLEALSHGLAVIAAKPNSTKIYERDITVSGLPAKEVKFRAKDVDYIARSMFVADRLFIFVAALNAKVDDAETIVKQALDSFEPVKK
jgi:hypothetical protein